MTDEQFNDALTDLLEKPISEQGQKDIYIANLIGLALEFDAAGFEKVFNSCLLKYGFISTIETILYPLLNKIGILWQREELHPAQEHFVSNIAKQKLFTAIDGSPIPASSDKKFILFLPEFEDHEIGLLYGHYLLLKGNIRSCYLGQRVPLESLVGAVDTIQSTDLFFLLTTANSVKNMNRYLDQLVQAFPKQNIYLSGTQSLLDKLTIPFRIQLIKNPEAFKKLFGIG